jgi:hypothetical protein
MPERDREPLLFRFPPSDHPGSYPRRLVVDLFGFAGWVLLIVLLITAIWPLNVPLLALAFKVSLGGQKMPFETGEFWWRTFLAGLGLAVFSVVFFFIAYLVIQGAELTEPQYRARSTWCCCCCTFRLRPGSCSGPTPTTTCSARWPCSACTS